MEKQERCTYLENAFFATHTDLASQQKNIMSACKALQHMYTQNGTLLICGNGGSSADSDHIVGELMKGFLLKRPLSATEQANFETKFGEEGRDIASKLQHALPAISLSAHAALISAFSNDVDPTLLYAQQVYGYGKTGDSVLGISTSGNAANVYAAMQAAAAKGLVTIGLTGRDGGKLKQICDICIIAPANATFQIQEYHLAIYHFICAYLEASFFEK